MIHIHTDVDDLKYFSDKNGVSAYDNRVISYAMQGANIVGVFYTKIQAFVFYNKNKNKENLRILYYWDENRWKKD